MSANDGPNDAREALRPRARFVGSRLGKYFVGARLAAGGTASVYLARLAGPHNFERLVALKIIHEHLAEEQEFVNMFLDEANLAAQLNHPNIVHVYELASEADVLFLAMEYLHGQPLSTVYRRAGELKRTLPLPLVAWIGARAAEGLHHAHELTDSNGDKLGLVHRDVSPQNIFVTYDGHVKVVDFGIARAEGRIAKTALGQIKGKFSYMSPEQALGHPFDHRADIFALGATLFEVATGTRLFKGEDEIDTLRKVVAAEIPNPRDLLPNFSEELERILRRALEPDPEERYSDGESLARDLDAMLKSLGGEDQKDHLTQVLAELFVDERATQERAITELREAAVRSEEAGTTATDETQVASGLDAQAPQRRRLSPVMVVGGVVALGAVIGIGGLAASGDPKPEKAPAAMPPPVSEQVVIDVTLQPDVEAEIKISGALVTERPARAAVDRSNVPVDVLVTAEGFRPATLSVVPDRDRAVLVPLTKLEAEPAPSAASDEPAGPRVRAREPSAPAKSREPAPKPKPASGIVTKNPF